MVRQALDITRHCGWASDFAIVGCDKPKGHSGPHRVGAAAGIPPGLSREEQEDYNRRMKGRIIGQAPADEQPR